MAARTLNAVLLLLLVVIPLASCQEFASNRRPLLRKPSGVATTGCYMVAMKDEASEAQLDEIMMRAVKASDDAKLYGMVRKVKKLFTVKLNPYALEMVSGTTWSKRGLTEFSLIHLTTGPSFSWS